MSHVRVAYLTNRYPAVSHTFIRREIHALEAQGTAVTPCSIRRSDGPLVDEADERERQRTQVIWPAGIGGLAALAGATAAVLVRRPAGFCRAVAGAWRLWRTADRSFVHHAAYLAQACRLVRLAQQRQIDHVHVHHGSNPAAVAMLSRLLGGPAYSFTVHGPHDLDRAVCLGFDQKIRHAAFAVAITHFCRSQLMRWCDFEQWDKITIVGCGLDDDFLEAEPPPLPARKRLVFVGRLCEQKAPLLLVEAVGQLTAEGVDIELVLVGDGEMRSQVERRIAALDVADRVTITGWASNERVREQICASRAMVLPSFAEGLPVVIMEALALGRPVISTYIAGIPELVEPGRCGWLVPAGSLEALTAAMRQAVQMPVEQLERMGAVGRERVRERHSAAANAARLGAHIREAHSRSSGAVATAEQVRPVASRVG